MAEQKSNKKYCSLAALRYGQVLYELEIPEEDIEETKAIWESSADLREDPGKSGGIRGTEARDH